MANTEKAKAGADLTDTCSFVPELAQELPDWQRLEKDSLYSDYAQKADNITVSRLGYLPKKDLTNRHTPLLRSLIFEFERGRIRVSEFNDEVDQIVKTIRNADMVYCCVRDYPEQLYEQYARRSETEAGVFVRDRLKRFLGYMPELKHSVVAELWMQDIVEKGDFNFSHSINSIDNRAIAQICYREVLLEKGQAEADNSELWFHARKWRKF